MEKGKVSHLVMVIPGVSIYGRKKSIDVLQSLYGDFRMNVGVDCMHATIYSWSILHATIYECWSGLHGSMGRMLA